MLQITRVDIVDGQTLDIELSNGHLTLRYPASARNKPQL